MKQLKHQFGEVEVNFLISNLDRDIVANASEMAAISATTPEKFLKLESTSKFIDRLLASLNSSEEALTYSKADLIYEKDGDIFMHRKLAIKFAFWLSDDFEILFFEVVDNLLYGNYKRHWDAHVIQNSSQAKMQELKQKLLLKTPTTEDVHAYFKAEKEFVSARMAKLRAMKDQYSLNFSEVDL